MCGDKAKHIHHKDRNKNNHSLNNLLPLCPTCHSLIHCNETYRNKYRKLEVKYFNMRKKHDSLITRFKLHEVRHSNKIKSIRLNNKEFEDICSRKWKRYYRKEYELWKETLN